MAVVISSVKENSTAQRLGIKPKDILIEINGYEINDVLDYGFYSAGDSINIKFARPDGGTIILGSADTGGEDIGLEFDSFLIDSERRCSNRCIFCFIDQLPQGMRKSLYYKDDDERLSFLFGNYLSLTNLSDRLVERIIDMRLSPVNISVHTTNPKLRDYMMGNETAGESLKHLYRLSDKGTAVNCQVVLCRGINDGSELERTLLDLLSLYPSVRSISVVPAGLTAHRKGLAKIEPFDAKSAWEVLSLIESFNDKCRKTFETGLIYPADEWYVLTNKSVPELEYYDELLQVENGVGMLALLKYEFGEAVEKAAQLQAVPVDIITGEAAAEWIGSLVVTAKKKFPAIHAEIHVVKNEFFGGNVSVAGLITGGDIMNQIKPDELSGDKILISKSLLRSEGDLLLDDISINDISVYYNKEVTAVSDGYEFFEALGR